MNPIRAVLMKLVCWPSDPVSKQQINSALLALSELVREKKTDIGQVVSDSEGTVVPDEKDLIFEAGRNQALNDILDELQK